MYLKDAPFDTLLVMVEGMDQETRRTYYVRRAGSSPLPNFVPAYRLACEQGEADEPPRYRATMAFHAYPGHTHGLTTLQIANGVAK